MKEWLDRIFKLTENRTSVRTEFLGGVTTFMTMSYIIFVQPAILSRAGMDKGAVMAATCIASAVATLLTGLLANYPIAQAPAMGHNVFFAVIVCGTMGYSWQAALGAVFISGVAQIVLSLFGFYDKLVSAVPDALKHAIAVGIGLLIALIGLEYGGHRRAVAGDLCRLGRPDKPSRPPRAFRRHPDRRPDGLEGSRSDSRRAFWPRPFVGIPLGHRQISRLARRAAQPGPDAVQARYPRSFQNRVFSPSSLSFSSLTSSTASGRLIGVSQPAGFMKNGKLPRANRAILADALGTAEGALLGTSTVSSYIESATGIAQGARTGWPTFSPRFFSWPPFFQPARGDDQRRHQVQGTSTSIRSSPRP